MKKFFSITACLIVSAIFCQVLLADQSKEELAASTSQAWLALVDAGKYQESWQQAAEFFKNAVDQNQWESSMIAYRKPLGNVLSRELIFKKYTNTLPGAPDGEYVVIQYKTSFENKASAVETVTPMLDTDGIWRVSGYYIK
jgi:hypothetical protein